MAEKTVPGVDIAVLGQADARLTALAAAGDVLATCVGRRVEVSTGLDAGRLVPNSSWVQPDDVGTLSVAPSGRFLLLRSAAGDAIEVRPTDGAPPLVRLAGDLPGRPTTAAAIAATPDGELLISSTERNRLQVRRLATGELLRDELVREPRGFFFSSLVPMLDGDTVIAIGYYADETKDSLVALSLRRLLTEDGYLLPTFHRPALQDYAYRLAAGPCGPAVAAFYRDPEDDEDPEDDDEDDPNRLDVAGIRGLYLRRLSDRAVLGTAPVDLAVPTGVTLAGTEHHVVLALSEGALVVPRSGAAGTLVPAAHVAVDPRSGRSVLAATDGRLRLLTLS
ncbi:hypothetical protein [Amycolatopsis solani]|uniref:hypothetical protein n=1 Tax=Amycolatopsis solani TaxID=3028615 RepID=UPI0025B062C5|nr:hypothetical protein [Amycolatopsis sp. MEP2-6]